MGLGCQAASGANGWPHHVLSAAVSVTFAVSVLVDGRAVDPTDLIDAVSTISPPQPLRVERAGGTVRFMAEERGALGDLAAPLFQWWQRYGTTAVLRLVGSAGISEIKYIHPERAVTMLRGIIETESGSGLWEDSMADAATDGPWAADVLRDAAEADVEGVYVIGVRETLDGESWSLMFQEPYDAEDPQEIRLGMDTYCLVVDPGQACYYGGVLECEIAAEELLLRLTEEAAAALGTPTVMRFTLAMGSDQLQTLRRGLARVLTSGRPDAVPQRLAV